MMAKSAQERFNEFLTDSRTTSEAVRDLVDSAYDKDKNYGYAAGYLQTLVADLIGELPKARREAVREQLKRDAQKIKNQMLINDLKETA
jgi:hypothetical protein